MSRTAHVARSDCECIRPGFVAQPANAASSLAYVVAGGVIARRARRAQGAAPWERRRRLALAAALVAAGVGSVAYHGPGGRWGKVAHDGSLALLVVAQGWRFAADRRRPDPLAGAVQAVATAVHASSRTGGPLCRPDSLLQGHALWHVLSAASIVLGDSRS